MQADPNDSLYYLLLNNQQAGPYTAHQLRSMWQNGILTAETPYCLAGGASWQALINLRTVLEPVPQPAPPSQAAPRPSPLDQQGCYSLPIRVEQQSHGGGGLAGGGFSSTSMGLAFKGAVCPTCRSANYIQTYSVWHGILAVCAFPLGLVGFAFPIKQCVDCQNRYGAGLEMTRVLAKIALGAFVIIAILVLAGVVASSKR